MDQAKIFGIGLNKTGTTTLAWCGESLGFRVARCDRDLLRDLVINRNFDRLNHVVSRYNLFQDWPWPLFYRKLDEMFPGSKFILTVRRDEKTWLESLKRHAIRKHPTNHSRNLAYGYSFPHGREQEHLRIYRKHNADVRAYFKERRNDFIELCWENGDGWDRLCRFLGKDIPDVPFPHANKGSARGARVIWRTINRLLIRTGD